MARARPGLQAPASDPAADRGAFVSGQVTHVNVAQFMF